MRRIKARRKKICNYDEDCLITIILKYIDVIEKKSTDQHLTPNVLETTLENAWKEIQVEFLNMTTVSFA